jgi:hypothetical protein
MDQKEKPEDGKVAKTLSGCVDGRGDFYMYY